MASAQRALSFVDSGDRPLRLGDEVGQGGEGAVFAIAGRDAVAKIYHKPLPAPKQQKLAAMVTVQIPALRSVAAWPLDVIHDRAGGSVVGLIVPKVTGYEEIHQLYSPLDRKTHFPDADWTFLVRAAANTAAATATMHAHGIVIGDINQNVFMVAKDATVKLIDCDSFQVDVNGQLYPCTVGVPDFTPPELQGQPLDATVRTPDHDAFGLAVILFHLLCMGRHPFAGKYLGEGDMPIQRAIIEARYAYGRQAGRVQMAPPPHTLPMAALGAEVTGFFEAAFDPTVSTGGRPTAEQWIDALERLLGTVKSCASVPAHKYLRTLPACPWCELEAISNTAMFNDSQSATLPPPFDLAAVMNRIASVPAPDEANMPNPEVIAMRPTPVAGMPPVAVGATRRRLSRAQYNLEYEQRQAALRQAQEEWDRFSATWEQEATRKPFSAKVSEGQQLKERYSRLEQELRTERDQAMMSAKSAQLHAYLRSYHLDQVAIPGLDPQQIALLAANGITTAAEVKRTRLQDIASLSAARLDALLRWRSDLEQRFHFDATQAPSAGDRARLDRTYRPQFLTLQAKLSALPSELDQIQRQVQARRIHLRQEGAPLAYALAQAQSDVAYLGQVRPLALWERVFAPLIWLGQEKNSRLVRTSMALVLLIVFFWALQVRQSGPAAVSKPTPTATATPTPPPPPATPASGSGVVNSNNAYLHFGPGADFDVVGTAQAGEEVVITGHDASGAWLQLESGAWIFGQVVDVRGGR